MLGGSGCSGSESKQVIKVFSTIVVNSENIKDNILFLDKNDKPTGSIRLGNYIDDIGLYKNYLLAIDSGWAEKPKKDLLRFNLKSWQSEILTLSISPHRLFIHEGVAFVSSHNEIRGKGFILVAIDINNFKIIGEKFIPGMVSAFAAKGNDIYISINSGGSKNYGKHSQIFRVNLSKDSFNMSNILKAKEELPPSYMYIDGNTIYGIYPGSKGKMKARWVEKPEDYSHKLKLINQTTGEITASISLQHLVPQSLVVDKNKKGYINHFTNIDLTGDTVSVYDLSSQKLLTTIKTETPSFIATDNQRLYVTNYTTDSLSVFDLKTLKKDKVIPVGKWPKKVILIESTL